MSFIGIDLGGTFIKGAILDTDELKLQHIRRTSFPGFEQGGQYERTVLADNLLHKFYELLDELLVMSAGCDGLLLCGQMHGMVFCDDQGIPKSEIITWQDQRALSLTKNKDVTYFNELKDSLADWDLQSLGNELRPGLPLTQLYVLQKQRKLPDRLYPASIMDFVAANLCRTAPSTDSTNASAHGLYKLIENNWDFHLIEKLRLDGLHWHEIKPPFSIIGSFTRNGQEIPCFVPFGDQQSALLGSFLADRELSLNIATGSQVSLLSSSLEFGDYQLRPYFENKYLKTITHIPAGRALNALIKLLTEISATEMESDSIWKYIQEEVEKISDSNLSVAITFNNSPFGSHGHITNMDENNMTIGNLFHAVFTNMAENYRICVDRLSEDHNWDRVVFSGGLVSKSQMLQNAILGKINSAPFRINPNKEDTLMGLLVGAAKIKNNHWTLEEAMNAAQAVNTIQGS